MRTLTHCSVYSVQCIVYTRAYTHTLYIVQCVSARMCVSVHTHAHTGGTHIHSRHNTGTGTGIPYSNHFYQQYSSMLVHVAKPADTLKLVLSCILWWNY